PPTDSHPLSLHDALPIYAELSTDLPHVVRPQGGFRPAQVMDGQPHRQLALKDRLELDLMIRRRPSRRPARVGEDHLGLLAQLAQDRKSTRLNSSHGSISY